MLNKELRIQKIYSYFSTVKLIIKFNFIHLLKSIMGKYQVIQHTILYIIFNDIKVVIGEYLQKKDVKF